MEQKRIGIVEDEGIVALQIRNSLEQRGYVIVGVYASGEEALKGFGESRPDLVLMDMKLQGTMDGIQAADLIRTRYAIPVIYLTAHSEPSTIERAKATEPYGYILKPFNEQELYIAIEVALHKHRVDRAKEALTHELEAALDKVKLLSGCLPICASCKQIRSDKGYWVQIEQYIRDHSEAEFTHSLCPACAKRLYPDIYKDR